MNKEFRTQNIPVNSNIFKMKASEFGRSSGFDEVPASDRLNGLAGRKNVSLSASKQYVVNAHTYVFMNLSSARNENLKLNLHYISISLIDRYKL